MANTKDSSTCTSTINTRPSTVMVRVMVLLITLLEISPCVEAQTFQVLHGFTGGTDGANPYGGLIRDPAGNLYGTTRGGGSSGNGTVFRLDLTGRETVLHSFTGADGTSPRASVILDSTGNLYGTTQGGGAFGNGTAFKLDTTGHITVLHSFAGEDGANPFAPLIFDGVGDLYGTTAAGGAFGLGTVFKLDASGNESVVHSFAGPPDGSAPYAGLLRDAAGNLLGTTNAGGSGSGCSGGCGTVFKLGANASESVLHSFSLGQYEAAPMAGLTSDAAGNFYGTTAGVYGACLLQRRLFYCGTVFKLDAAGNETVLARFNISDGALPNAALVRDASGNLYGTTVYGGTYPSTHGTVFKVDPTGTVTILHNFTGGADGANPYSGLIMDAPGALYGTTVSGGASGFGTVFKITP